MLPQYQLKRGPGWLEVWQLPSAVTPALKKPLRLGRLSGSRHELFETLVTRWLKAAGIGYGPHGPAETELDEDTASQLGLLCRCLGPMRSVSRMRQVAAGIDAMKPQETSYWLGMALYRYKRALPALRLLLTEAGNG